MRRHLKLKLNDSLQIIEASIIDPNTGKLIQKVSLTDAKSRERLKQVIESGYIEFVTYKKT